MPLSDPAPGVSPEQIKTAMTFWQTIWTLVGGWSFIQAVRMCWDWFRAARQGRADRDTKRLTDAHAAGVESERQGSQHRRDMVDELWRLADERKREADGRLERLNKVEERLDDAERRLGECEEDRAELRGEVEQIRRDTATDGGL